MTSGPGFVFDAAAVFVRFLRLGGAARLPVPLLVVIHCCLLWVRGVCARGGPVAIGDAQKGQKRGVNGLEFRPDLAIQSHAQVLEYDCRSAAPACVTAELVGSGDLT